MHQPEFAGCDDALCYLCSFGGRISLYCLALQDIQQHCSQLQEEKCLVSFCHFSLINTVMKQLSSIFLKVQNKIVVLFFLIITFILLQMFLQMVKIIFSCHFPKDKCAADFSKNILQMQEKVDPDQMSITHTYINTYIHTYIDFQILY